MLLHVFKADRVQLKPLEDVISVQVSFALKDSEIQGRRQLASR